MDQNGTIDKLIINSPYNEPLLYWLYNRETRNFNLKEGRRPAGYVIATEHSHGFDDPGIFVLIELVEKIRPRVKKWKENGYPGVTGITKRLLEHWYNKDERENQFFFCQLEAIETIIWLTEAPESEKVGIEIPSDGGEFQRICSKMATGSGKTIVMAMLIAWNVLNKSTYPKDTRFSKNVLVIAPGLTVKNRLQVLNPSDPNSYYELFSIVPDGLLEKLREGKVLIQNWHNLAWETEEKLKKGKSVDKRGAKSDEAYAREVLSDLSNSRNFIVINDEAHHAWRNPGESKIKGIKKEDYEEATIWIEGLDRINKARGILTCYDFSATPFAPTGKKNTDEALFSWIVSDFGLNDAIESGLVKTPRVVIRDDGQFNKDYKSRLYHIYNDNEVKDNLSRKAEASEPLPDLVKNAYYLLGKDWLETYRKWKEAGQVIPPVMITVANITETSSRIKYAFDHKEIMIDELCDPEFILQIDSKILNSAELQSDVNDLLVPEENSNTEPKLSKKDQAILLREKVDTVGKPGKPGEQIRNVISVSMLSEGWDAKNVTHIMGLRAFSSQLLCEQVVGRGLRRTSYDIDQESGLFTPEYVNIFGVPFTFLPHEGGEGTPPAPATPKTQIESLQERSAYNITWPNVIRIDHMYKPILTLDINSIHPIEIDPTQDITSAELAPIINGKPNLTYVTEIELKQIAEEYRTQKMVFEVAKKIFNNEKTRWKGRQEFMFAQLIALVDKFLNADKITIKDDAYRKDPLKRKVLIILNLDKIVQYIWREIRLENTESYVPVFDAVAPFRSTADMRTWYTGKPCERTILSQINFCVYDSTWEASEAYQLDHNPLVEAWAKNDHLGFEIVYNYEGIIRKYRPDFLIRLKNGVNLILETKGKDKESGQNKAKWEFLDEWVKAINSQGGFGVWKWKVSFTPNDVENILNEITVPSNTLYN